MKFAGTILLSVILSAGIAAAQGVAFRDSVFDAELMKVLVHQSERGGNPDLPTLTLTAQYSRRRPFDDQSVYERGPYDLSQQIFRSSYSYNIVLNTIENHSIDLSSAKSQPTASAAVRDDGLATRSVDVAPYPVSWYVGAMLVRSARVGDLPNEQDPGDNYLIRVAAVPVKYMNDTLWLLALLQRAELPVKNPVTGGDFPAKDISTVYQKLISLTSRDPLTLQLPPLDTHDETEEDVTLSLETPQGFGLAKNVPDSVVTRTMFAYAIPSQCNVKLTVSKPDGTMLDTLVHQVEEAGVYRTIWDAGKYPAGTYFCSMEATPYPNGAPYFKQISVTKIAAIQDRQAQIADSPDSLIQQFPVATIPLEQQSIDHVFRVLVEGGAGYTEPQNPASPFDNMFSHVSIGLGFTLTKQIEVGILFGQDGFHRQRQQLNPYIVPATDNEIETYNVPWIGGYGRVYFSSGGMRGFAHFACSAASGGIVSTLGLGVVVPVSSGLSLYLMPDRTDQWTVHPSTKWGANYGIEFYF